MYEFKVASLSVALTFLTVCLTRSPTSPSPTPAVRPLAP